MARAQALISCVIIRGEGGRVEIVRLVCLLKAVTMLIKRHKSQWEAIEHTLAPAPYGERKMLLTQNAAVDS